jgi:quercetin dioxygenase-like cupin family protein
MRTFLMGILISFALIAMSQDGPRKAAIPDSSASNFASLEPFVRGLALANREVTIYRLRTNSLPSHTHSRPIVIVWTREGTVAEEKDGEASTTRKVSVGQIDVYPSGTTHSLRAVKGAMHFTLIELKQNLRDPKEMPNKPTDCKRTVDFPGGGFACLMQLANNEEITIPELDVNFFLIALDKGRVRYTVPRHQWEAQYPEGRPSYLPGYEEHGVRNLERRTLQFVLIVPPPAEYN